MVYKKMVANKTSAVAKLTKKVNKIIKQDSPEVKFRDTNLTINVNILGSVTPIYSLLNGSEESQRVGNQIHARSLHLTGWITWNQIGDLDQALTMWVVKDTQQIDSTTPTFAAIFDDIGCHAKLNPYTKGRFQVISQKRYVRDTSKTMLQLDQKHYFKDALIKFSSTASYSYQKNSIYVVVASNKLLNIPQVGMYNRAFYTDA